VAGALQKWNFLSLQFDGGDDESKGQQWPECIVGKHAEGEGHAANGISLPAVVTECPFQQEQSQNWPDFDVAFDVGQAAGADVEN